MARKEIYVIVLALISIMITSPNVSAVKDTLTDLKSAISSFDDPHMDADDLAFYLATHDFDAKPKGNYVEVGLGDKTCKLTPNGSAPGLCTISI
jgi:hypothetical protein